MTNDAVTTYALDADWLNDQSVNTNYVHTETTGGVDTITTVGGWWPYDYPQPWYIWPTPVSTVFVTQPEKIALKLSEIEQLRKMARQNKKLKAVLQKFTHLIEIEVDFD